MVDQHRPFIGGFGSSDLAEATQTGGIGTFWYKAPQQDGQHYGERVDVYAFGVMCLEIPWVDVTLPAESDQQLEYEL